MNHTIEPIVFDDADLTPMEVPVKVGSKNYILREALEEEASKYRNELIAGMKFGPDGKPQSMRGTASTQSLLVSLCLYETNDKGEATKLVPLTTIRKWPSKVVKKIFETAKKISDLGEEDEETVEELERKLEEARAKVDARKNESTGTTDTSD